MNEYNTVYENKVKAFLNMKSTLSEDEAIRLGKKSDEVEMEKFIQANTQELAKDKWLCPLLGKKFKGPEFIRKHIIMKYNDKVDEVKVEVRTRNKIGMFLSRQNWVIRELLSCRKNCQHFSVVLSHLYWDSCQPYKVIK